MMATVKQSFTTQLRRFRARDEVSPRDDLAPHTFESLRDAGYIEPLPAARPDRPTPRSRKAR
jgi:hypothetical protein